MIEEIIGYFIFGSVIGYWGYYKIGDRIINTVIFSFLGLTLMFSPLIYGKAYSGFSGFLYTFAVIIGSIFGKYFLHYKDKKESDA